MLLSGLLLIFGGLVLLTGFAAAAVVGAVFLRRSIGAERFYAGLRQIGGGFLIVAFVCVAGLFGVFSVRLNAPRVVASTETISKPAIAVSAEIPGGPEAVHSATAAPEPGEPVPREPVPRAAIPAEAVEAETAVAVPAEAEVATPVEPVPAELAEAEPAVPEWVRNPDGGRVVVETDFRVAAEDPMPLLRTAVSQAFRQHLEQQTESSLPAPTVWKKLIQVNLSETATERCIVAKFDRSEIISTAEGPQTMIKTLALVEFPESIEHPTLAKIRRTVQQHRAWTVAVALLFLWMAFTSAGLLVRFTVGGSSLRKLISIPATVLIPVPLLLVAGALIAGIYQEQTRIFPWEKMTEISGPADAEVAHNKSSASAVLSSPGRIQIREDQYLP